MPKQRSVKVVKHKGEVKIGGIWAWADPRWPNIWIGGLCSGNRIEIGCHPTSGDEVHEGCLFHEFGHYWLANNGYGLRHVPMFKSVFGPGWDDGLLKSIRVRGIAVDPVPTGPFKRSAQRKV